MPVQSFIRSLVVAIGIDAYGPGIPRLSTAANDATALAELLCAEHGYEAILLTEARTGGPVTKERLAAVFTQSLPARLGPDDRLLVYFAGHGVAVDGEDGPAGYILPQDARPDDRSSFVSMKNLHAWLGALPCRHMLAILDCCFAGAFRWASTRNMRPPAGVLHKERFDRYIRSPAWQAITSASYDQRALDVLTGSIAGSVGTRGEAGGRHSPFAQALFAALQGAADLFPAGKGDGVITASELALYLRETVEVAAAKGAHAEQTPQLWPLTKHRKGEFIFLVPGRPVRLPKAEALTERNNPYRGLRPYEREDSVIFFGRREEIAELVRRVDGQACVAVIGASGTGKSSLVKAGLLPALEKAGRLWQVLPPMRPAEHPIQALAALLHANLPGVTFRLDADDGLAAAVAAWRAANPGRCLVVTVDQCEELITLCRDEARRDQFLRLLAVAVGAPGDAFRLILTLRTDFEPQLADKPLFAGSDGRANRYVIPPMDQDALRDVIEGPAAVRELYFEPPELVDELINEVVQMPGALPLLSFTLSEMYVRYVRSGRDDRALTAADYQAVGGVVGSLRQRATEEYEGLPDDAHRATMERVMLRMIAAEGGGELARRRVGLSELDYPTDAENARVKTVLDRLVEARLVVRGTAEGGSGSGPPGAPPERGSHDEPYVEPAHDALVLAWDRLLQWKREAEEYLPLQRRVSQASQEWQRAPAKEKDGLLWNDDPRLPLLERTLAPVGQTKAGPLGRAKRTLWPDALAPGNTAWLNRLEVAFTQASVQRRAAVLKRVVAITAAVIVALTGLAVFAGLQANNATLQRNEANVQRNIAQTREVDAVNEANLRSTEVVVRSTAQANEAAARQVAQTREVEAQAAATAEAQARQRAERESRVAQARALAARADAAPGSNPQLRLLLASEAVGTTYRVDGDMVPEAHAALYSALAEPGFRAEMAGHDGWIFSASWSPDDKYVLTTDARGTTRLWSADGSLVAKLGEHGSDTASAFGPGGSRILTASKDGAVRFYTPSGDPDGKISTGAELWGGSFSPKGERVLTVGFASVPDSKDGRASVAQVWDGGGRLLATLRDRNANIASAAFSPDGARVLTAGEDGMARLWTADGKELGSFQAQGSWVTPASFSPDGNLVVVGGCGPRSVGSWSPFSCPRGRSAVLASGTGSLIAEMSGHAAEMTSALFSPDGEMIATTGWDGTARLSDAAGRLISVLRGQPGAFWSAGFRPDGAQVATATESGAQVWDPSGRQVGTLDTGVATVLASIFNSSGTEVLTTICQTIRQEGCLGKSAARVWATEGAPLGNTEGSLPVLDILASPDGSRVLTTHQGAQSKLWDAAGREAGALGSIAGTTPQFDAGGARLYAPQWKGGIRDWNADGVELGTFSSSGPAIVFDTNEGTRVVTAEPDYTLALRDENGNVLRGLQGHTGPINSMRLSQEGKRILSASDDGTVRLWSLDAEPLAVLQGSGRMLWADAAGRRILTVGKPANEEAAAATAELWTEDGKRVGVLNQWTLLEPPYTPGALSPDGTRIAFFQFGPDQPMPLLDEDGALVASLDRPDQNEDRGALISPDSQRILMIVCTGPRMSVGYCSDENGVYLWNRDGTFLRALVGTDTVDTAAFSPDGSKMLVTRRQGGVELYDRDGNLLAALEDQGAASFTPDGSAIGLIDEAGKVWRWKVWRDVEEMRAEAARRAGRTFTAAECQEYLGEPECPAYVQ